MAYERLISKITKENLWLYISRLLSERPMYAYETATVLKSRFGFSTATITVYVVLYKMLHEGLVVISNVQPDGRKDRRYYELTEKGKETFDRGKALLRNFLAKID